MARDIDDIIHPASDPVIAVFVAAAAIAGEILALVGLEIGIDETLMIAIDGAHLSRPAACNHQIAGCRAFQDIAIGIHDLRHHAGQRQGGRARLQGGGAGQGGDQMPASLGLPPGVHNRAASVADHAMIPVPRFRIDRLAHRSQQAQAGAAGFGHGCIALAHQGADRRGRGVKDIDLVLVDHLPEARTGGIIRHAFEHQGGGAIGQRAIENITVTGDPTDIGGAPIDIALVIIEHVMMRPGRP